MRCFNKLYSVFVLICLVYLSQFSTVHSKNDPREHAKLETSILWRAIPWSEKKNNPITKQQNECVAQLHTPQSTAADWMDCVEG